MALDVLTAVLYFGAATAGVVGWGWLAVAHVRDHEWPDALAAAGVAAAALLVAVLPVGA